MTNNDERLTMEYTNPVYQGYFADPFVWQHEGVYYAIGTGAAEAEGTLNNIDTPNKSHVFPLLRSFDFANWHFVDHALLLLDPALGNNYWAPEVACSDGQFYLYYSVGHEDKTISCVWLQVIVL